MDLNQIHKINSVSSYIEGVLKEHGINTRIVLSENSRVIYNKNSNRNNYKYTTDHNYCNSNNCENTFYADQTLDNFSNGCSHTDIA